jgi:hypothetical protein
MHVLQVDSAGQQKSSRKARQQTPSAVHFASRSCTLKLQSFPFIDETATATACPIETVTENLLTSTRVFYNLEIDT